jgi:hypothetical protein
MRGERYIDRLAGNARRLGRAAAVAAVLIGVLAVSAGPAAAADKPGIWIERPEWNAWVRSALDAAHKSVSDTSDNPHYKATYVRCYTPAGWRAVGLSSRVLGYYLPNRRTPWIHVRESTCGNALKARAGQLDATNAVALMVILHEAFHRQGVDGEKEAQCLAVETLHQALRAEWGEARANRAYDLARRWARRNLPLGYFYPSDSACRAAAAETPWSRWN